MGLMETERNNTIFESAQSILRPVRVESPDRGASVFESKAVVNCDLINRVSLAAQLSLGPIED